MAKEKKLDCVILGLLSHEALTGYEIKKRMDTTLHSFWGASYGSIYPTLNGLMKRGLAIQHMDASTKRQKIRYAITPQGHAYVKDWLKQPATIHEVRYEMLLKIFFGAELGAEQALKHIRAFQEDIQQELTALRAMEDILKACLQEDKAHSYYLLTVRFGIQTYQAYLAWCEEATSFLSEGGN